MSDRCKKSKKLTANKKKYRRCHFIMSDNNNSCANNETNQMATTMQQFCTDSNIMLNPTRKCSITESHKRRRRFHPLRNLRRIFRRRTLAHADAIRPIVQQHQNYYHRNDVGSQQYPGDSTNASTIRSLSAQSIDDDVLPDDLSDFQSSHLIRSTNQSNLLAATKRAYYYTKDGAGKRLNHPGVMDLDTETDSDLAREMLDYQRSLSEGRLLDNDFSRETLSHSHDSVFSESATASSLSIVLKAELADALRKRKSRSDASDEDLGLPRSPSTPPRNGNHHVVDGQINSTNNVGRQQHHSSLGLLSMASSEIYDDSMESSSFLSTSKSSYEIGKHDTSDDIFPPEISLNSSRDLETRLSHSAAKHKMAIRPKKKGPSRPPRKPTDILIALPPMPEVNEDFLKSSSVIESYVNKSQSLPRGVTSITTTKTTEKHTNMSTTLNKQTKSKFGKTIYTSSELDSRDQNIAAESNKSVLHSTIKSEVKTLDSKREERTHSEEGFFRRFINRSGRKQKKDRDPSVDTDTLDAIKPIKKIETSTPAIKKSAELSIINVLSNARASETKSPLISYISAGDETEKSPKSLIMKNDKLRSGPIARQRYTKDVSDIEKSDSNESQKLPSHSNRQEFATSYLRFSPTKSFVSQCDEESDSFVRSTHYRSEEMLSSTAVCDTNTFNDNGDNEQPIAANYSVSLPKSVWPNEQKCPQNVHRNGYGWGQCQQKISKLTNEQQQSQTKIQTKAGKMVEKSKSFRLYTKNFNNEQVAQTMRTECKPSLCPSLPDLNASNRSPLARPSRYSSNRENLQSLRFLNSSGNHLNSNPTTKWTPTRSSSSSRISEHRFGSNRFEINDMNLIPNSKLYSTLNTSDEIASYDIEKDDTHIMSATAAATAVTTTTAAADPSILQVPSKTHHSIQNTNINEIEDNIDKIMKSSVVTVLKKSPTAELYQIKTNNGNVSLTTITKDENGDCNGLNVATVENPPLLRHSTTATKLDLQVPSLSSPPKKIISDIPEFMQLKLNRVDASRPKSCIEYTSNVLSTTSQNNNVTTPPGANEEDKERRFSNESIEISDKKKAISTSAMNVFNPNLNKSSESLKSGFGRQSRASIGSQQLSRGSSTSDLNKTSIMSDPHSSDDCLDIDLDDDEGHVVIERRKSVSDKKLKFEQQIEKIQAEVKRSSIIGADKARKLSLEDDASSTVILRGKKSPKSSESDDPTPELMKVFARRSLKIKDTDDYQVHDDAEREALNQKLNDDTNNNMNRINNAKNANRFNTDSDKENHVTTSGAQSSIPKVEIYIKPTKDEKCDASPKKDATKNNVDNMTSVRNIGKLFNGAANRFSTNPTNSPVTVNNYRNSTAFFENLKNSPNHQSRGNSKSSADTTPDNGVVLIIEKNQTNNIDTVSNKFNAYNNNFTKNSTPIISNKIGQIQSPINRNSNCNSTTTVANDDTIITNKISGTAPTQAEQDLEYKGILERKAEWEKRASQAFK